MLVNYEGAEFKVGWSSSIERHLIKQAVKKKLGRWIGKPSQPDAYLEWSRSLLTKKPFSIVVDVGANIGTTVLPLAVEYPTTKFFAIEPHPLPASSLIQNCQNNHVQNVSLLSAAIGLEKTAQIHTCPTNSGGHRLTGFQGRKDIEKCAIFGPINVPMRTLSDVFTDFSIKHCDILKIDTEGYEFFVLESLGNFCPDYVIAEYGPEGLRQAGKSGWEVIALMLKKGYRCAVLGSNISIDCEKEIPSVPDFTVIDLLFSLKKQQAH